MKAGKGILSGAAAILLVACSSSASPSGSATLDSEELEADILTTLNDAGIPAERVSCPAGREFRKGDSFACSAEDAQGRPVTVQVTQTDGNGAVFIKTTTLYAPGVEDWIEQGNATDAACPDGIPYTDGEGTIECTATVSNREATLVVTVVDGEVTSVLEKDGTGPGEPSNPTCSDLWSGGADPPCDACAAQNCCDELLACVSGTPCAEYTLCERGCPAGDDACIEETCGQLSAGRAAARAVRECMTACPASCS